MKKRTCKLLLGLGLIWIFLLFIAMLYSLGDISSNKFVVFFSVSLPAWILIGAAWIKWGSATENGATKVAFKANEAKDEFMIN